jgi:hypothetical protein
LKESWIYVGFFYLRMNINNTFMSLEELTDKRETVYNYAWCEKWQLFDIDGIVIAQFSYPLSFSRVRSTYKKCSFPEI